MKMKFTKWSMAIALFAMTLLLPLEVTAKKLYLDAGGSSLWDQGGAWFSAWVWGSQQGDAWYKATKGDVYYEIDVPDDATGMKWVRFSNVATTESWTKVEGQSDGYWNQTGDLKIPTDGMNKFTITDWNDQTTGWSTYTPPTPEPDPDQPVDPEDPDTPVDPEDPDQPVDPEDPDQPVDPEDPDQPVDPEDPDTPVVPDPEEPEEPAGITFTVQVPEGTIECYVTGDPLWNTGDFLQMEKVEGEENLFTVTTTALKGTAWKYCSGPGWAYVEKDAQGNEITDRKTAGNPDVVAKWALLYEPDAEPIEPYYAVRGLVSWDMADDIKLTANAEGTEYAITGLDIEADKEFKVIYVDENVNITWYGVSALEANPEITQTGTDNIILAAGKYDIYFKVDTKTIWIDLTSVDDPDQPVDPEDPDQPVDPEDPDTPVDPEDPDQPVDPEDPDTPVVPDPEEPTGITFTVQVPEGTIECYITGADLWNTGEFLQMEKVEGEENLFTITTTALKGTEWKYASGPSWDYVEKDAQGGEVANRTEAGNPDVVASWLALYTPEVDPEDPDTPVDPEDPDQPVDPEDPDQPVDPEDPDQPVDPEDPDTPVVPDPEEPAAITFTVQVPEGTIECYITGADLWNTGEFLQMEKVEGEYNLFTITTTALKGTAWKYCSGPSWDYVEKDAQGNEITDRTEAGNPDVVASWLAVYTPAVDPEDPDTPVDPEDPDQPVDVEEVAAFAIYATNGTIYADCEFAIYNLIGIDVTAQNGSLNGKYIVKTEKGSKLISVW